jgi:hypothetical protein
VWDQIYINRANGCCLGCLDLEGGFYGGCSLFEFRRPRDVKASMTLCKIFFPRREDEMMERRQEGHFFDTSRIGPTPLKKNHFEAETRVVKFMARP